MYQGYGNKMVHQKTVPESSEKTSWSNPGEWFEFEKPGTICYILATYRFSLVLRWQANFFLVCMPVFLPRGDCNRQKVRDSICNLVCTESGGGWNTELDWGTRKGSQVPQFGHSPVSASIDPVHFCRDLIDSVAGIAHLLGNSNGKTHFPIQEGRSLQVSMQGWERPPRYFIKICTVIFPLLGRDNSFVCVCVFLLPAEHLAEMQLCGLQRLGCLRWAHSTPQPILSLLAAFCQASSQGPVLRGNSEPALRTIFQCCIVLSAALFSSVCFSLV